MIAEETLLDFAGALFKSVWALVLLLALKHPADRSWQTSDIIKELRGSQVVVTEALSNLVAAGLVLSRRITGATAISRALQAWTKW